MRQALNPLAGSPAHGQKAFRLSRTLSPNVDGWKLNLPTLSHKRILVETYLVSLQYGPIQKMEFGKIRLRRRCNLELCLLRSQGGFFLLGDISDLCGLELSRDATVDRFDFSTFGNWGAQPKTLNDPGSAPVCNHLQLDSRVRA